MSLHASILSVHGSILSVHASILSVHGPPRPHFEPGKLLKFDFDANTDLAFRPYSDPDPAFKYNADPGSETWI